MAFLTAKTDAASIKESSNTKFINTSGIYPVTVLAPFVDVSKNGSKSVNFLIEHDGQQQTIYSNLTIFNNNGSDNVIGQETLNKLLIIKGIDDIADPVDMALPVGKEGAEVDCAVLEDLCDIECYIKIQMQYSRYNGNIQERKAVTGFYAANKASAYEIVNNEEAGTQFAKDEVYASKNSYKDGLDEEQVNAWIAAKRPKGTAGTTTTKPAALGERKRFGKA